MRFVLEYCVDQNATRAAIRAGYGTRGAQVQGSRLLSNVMVRAEIDKRLEAARLEIEKRAKKKGITLERWLRELALIAFADMDDFGTVIERKRMVGPFEVTEKRVDLTLSAKRKRGRSRVIKKLGDSKDGPKLELHDKQKALDTIGKHFGWLVEKHELTGKDGVPLKSAALSPEERKKRLALVMKMLGAIKGNGNG